MMFISYISVLYVDDVSAQPDKATAKAATAPVANKILKSFLISYMSPIFD